MLRTPVFITIMSLMFFTLASCGSQEKKPTQDILLTERAFAHIERLRQAYVAGDMAGLEALCSDKAFKSMRKGMKKSRSVRLEFGYEWVRIRTDGIMEIQLGWKGSWSLAGKDKEAAGKGTAVFSLGGRPMKLAGITGASPFAGP